MTTDPTPIDVDAVGRQVALVSRAMAAHGGGLELADIDARGSVRLRFTGLCAGCRLRPLTFAETIEPAILSVEGVTGVKADGARISEEALARLRHYHGGNQEGWRIHPIESNDLSL